MEVQSHDLDGKSLPLVSFKKKLSAIEKGENTLTPPPPPQL